MNAERKNSVGSDGSNGPVSPIVGHSTKKKRAGQGSRARRKKALEKERLKLLHQEVANLSITTYGATASEQHELLSTRAQKLFWSYLNDGGEDDIEDGGNSSQSVPVNHGEPSDPAPVNHAPHRRRSRRPSAIEWLQRANQPSKSSYEDVFKGGPLALTMAAPVQSVSPRRKSVSQSPRNSKQQTQQSTSIHSGTRMGRRRSSVERYATKQAAKLATIVQNASVQESKYNDAQFHTQQLQPPAPPPANVAAPPTIVYVDGRFLHPQPPQSVYFPPYNPYNVQSTAMAGNMGYVVTGGGMQDCAIQNSEVAYRPAYEPFLY